MDRSGRSGRDMIKESLDRVHHIAVSVPDIAKAVDWYRQTFNCKVSYQDETWAFLDFANIKLALVVPSQHPSHIALMKDDAAKFGDLKKHRDGTRSVYIEDPFGNSVEILSKD
jgi:catechol 2,3-dioxygenase-like lactoylglutathione lyase family enzyme